MQHVSSLGGPRVMLPTSEICRWIDNIGDSTSTREDGLYGLACSVSDYCAVISPWGTQLVIFGDDPSDIFYFPKRALELPAASAELLDLLQRLKVRDGWCDCVFGAAEHL